MFWKRSMNNQSNGFELGVFYGSLAKLALFSTLLCGCTSGEPTRSETVSRTQLRGVVVQGCNPVAGGTIGGRHWYTTTVGPQPFVSIGDIHGSACYDGTAFNVSSNATGAGYRGWAVQEPDASNPPDALQFVYTRISQAEFENAGGVEVTVRVSSASRDGVASGFGAQAGVMVREAPASADPVSNGALNCKGIMGAGFFSFGTPQTNCTSPNAEIGSFGATSRTRPDIQGNVLGWSSQVNTRFIPSDVLLRLQVVAARSHGLTVGRDFSVAYSKDGTVWHSLPGGKITAEGALLVGFYASGEYTNTNPRRDAHAAFEEVYVGPPRLEKRTSYVGSSAASSARGWVTRELQAFSVAPDGTSYKYTNNALDGLMYQPMNAFSTDGWVLQVPAESNFYGVPQGGIAATNTYVYVARWLESNGVRRNFVVQRRAPFLAGPPDELTHPFISNIGIVGGLAAHDGYEFVFVSDWESNLVRVYDSVGTSIGEFPFPHPGLLAVEPDTNRIWVAPSAINPGAPLPPHLTSSAFESGPSHIECFESASNYDWSSVASCGSVQFSSLGVDNATAFAFAPTINPVLGPDWTIVPSISGNLLVADNGPNQNVRRCWDLTTTPRCADVGVPGGAFAGPTPGITEAGPQEAPRFFSLRGVGADQGGNIYVASGAPRVDIRRVAGTTSWVEDWREQWAIHGLSPEPGAFDPDGNSPSFFTLTRRLDFHASNNEPGTEWAPKAVTWSPFGTHASEDARRFAMTTPGASAPWIRNITKPGESTPRRFMFVMYLDYDAANIPTQIFQFLRFDGEIAKPCGSIEWRYAAPRRLSLWTDENGDGRKPQGNEVQNEVVEFSGSQMALLPNAGFGVDVDKNGDLWLAFAWWGVSNIHHLSLKGINAFGALKYFDSSTASAPEFAVHALPDFPSGRPVAPRYDATNHILYLYSLLSEGTCPEHPAVLRYVNWPDGVAGASAQRSYIAPLVHPATHHDQPENVRDLYYDSLCGCSSSTCMGCLSFDYISFDVAGSYFFAQDYWGPVHVHNAQSGAEVTQFTAGPEISGRALYPLSGDTMRARKLGNEYLITFNDQSDNLARTVLYRWTP